MSPPVKPIPLLYLGLQWLGDFLVRMQFYYIPLEKKKFVAEDCDPHFNCTDEPGASTPRSPVLHEEPRKPKSRLYLIIIFG